MWLIVIFDLPTKTPKDRLFANQFRNFLIKDGYIRLQLSVYARICNGQERVDKHLKRVKSNLPPKGNVRAFQLTDRQYGNMKFLLGKPQKNSPEAQQTSMEQLFLF